MAIVQHINVAETPSLVHGVHLQFRRHARGRLSTAFTCLLFSLCLFLVAEPAAIAARKKEPERAKPVKREVRTPWFADIVTPVQLLPDDGAALCNYLRRALNSGKPSAGFPAALKKDTTVRVVAVAWGSGKSPARIRYGTGQGLEAALNDVVPRVLEADKTAGAAEWLQLDVVQQVAATPAFLVNPSTRSETAAAEGIIGTAFPLPSVVGIAFSGVSGLAFLPEQLVGIDAVDARRLLRPQKLSDALASEQRWNELGAWNKIASFPDAQPVFFFEPQSFFNQAGRTIPVFRCNPPPAPVTPVQLRQALADGVAFAMENVLGAPQFNAALPQWRESHSNRLMHTAAFAVALQEAQRALPDLKVQETVDQLLEKLLDNVETYPRERQARCVVESFLAPLDTNALTAIALARKADLSDGQKRELGGIARFLLAQFQPDGSLTAVRNHPSGSVKEGFSMTASGQTVVALIELYEFTSNEIFLTHAEKALNYLLDTYENNQHLAPNDWTVYACNRLFTYTRSEKLRTAARAMAASVAGRQTLQTSFPDLVGSYDEHPSTTLAAKGTFLLNEAAQLMTENLSEDAGAIIMSPLHLSLIFQLQGQYAPPLLLFTGSRDRLRGGFRADCIGTSLDIESQWQQILALSRVLQFLSLQKTAEQTALPLTESATAALKQAADQMATFPRILKLTPDENTW